MGRWLWVVCGVWLMMAWSGAVSAQESWPTSFTELDRDEVGAEDAAIIVAVEDYVFVGDIPGAVENANGWYNYLRRTQGVPRQHISLLRNEEATVEGIRDALDAAVSNVGPGGTLWFIFIGHGAPSADGEDGVLIGVDAQQNPRSLYSRSLSRADVLKVLESGPQKQTVALLDACFSGRGADGRTLVTGLQPLLPTAGSVQANNDTIVLAAGGPDQFAGPLPRLRRPAFSYLMLGALRGWADANTDQQVTVGEALDYTSDTLKIMITDRQQDPQRLHGAVDQVLAAGTMEPGPDLDAVRLSPIPQPPSDPNNLLGVLVRVGGIPVTPTPAPQFNGIFRVSAGLALLSGGVLGNTELTLQSATLGDQSELVNANVGNLSDTTTAYAATMWFVGNDEGFGFSTGMDFVFSTDLDGRVRVYSDDEVDPEETQLKAALSAGREYELGGMFMYGLLLEPNYRIKWNDFALVAQTGVGFYLGAFTILKDEGMTDANTLSIVEYNESVFTFWLTVPVRAIAEYQVADNYGVGVMYSYFILPDGLQQIQLTGSYGF